jgi:hypothetical protein
MFYIYLVCVFIMFLGIVLSSLNDLWILVCAVTAVASLVLLLIMSVNLSESHTMTIRQMKLSYDAELVECTKLTEYEKKHFHSEAQKFNIRLKGFQDKNRGWLWDFCTYDSVDKLKPIKICKLKEEI